MKLREICVLPKIKFKVSSFSPWRCGHGVLFYHDDFSVKSKERVPVAFIEGYDWLHKPEEEIVIQILPPDSEHRLFENTLLPSRKIINEIKDGIKYFLKYKRKHGRVKGKIIAWFNG